MRGRVDGLIKRNDLKLDQITKVTHLTGAGQAELLIEITVVEMALPIDTDQLTAHHSSQIFRVVRILEEGLICLLYTSPSPRDPKTSRMPSSA